MPAYKVTLVRSFAVEIEARSPDDAARLSEFFIGYSDDSKAKDREEYSFVIRQIEIAQNDALETELMEEENGNEHAHL